MIKFTTEKYEIYTKVKFELTKGTIKPKETKNLEDRVPYINPKKGVIISGQGPNWLFALIANAYHPGNSQSRFRAPWVAIHDQLDGAVIVAATITGPNPSDTIIKKGGKIFDLSLFL